MPAQSPPIHAAAQQCLEQIAQGMRDQRLALGISTVAAALAAGMSRATWHRIEKAEPSVTMGAYAAAMQAIGLTIKLARVEPTLQTAAPEALPQVSADTEAVPSTIAIQKYPQLRQLAWHVRDGFELTTEEAYGLYDRNRRHLRIDQMTPEELQLWRALEMQH